MIAFLGNDDCVFFSLHGRFTDPPSSQLTVVQSQLNALPDVTSDVGQCLFVEVHSCQFLQNQETFVTISDAQSLKCMDVIDSFATVLHFLNESVDHQLDLVIQLCVEEIIELTLGRLKVVRSRRDLQRPASNESRCRIISFQDLATGSFGRSTHWRTR